MTTNQILTELKIVYAPMFSALFGNECNKYLDIVFSKDRAEIYKWAEYLSKHSQSVSTKIIVIKNRVNQECIDILISSSNINNELKLILK